MIDLDDLALTIIPKIIPLCNIQDETKNKIIDYILSNYKFNQYLHELDMNESDYNWHIRRVNNLIINYLKNLALIAEEVIFIIDEIDKNLFKYIDNEFTVINIIDNYYIYVV